MSSFCTWLPKVLRDAGVDVYVMPGAETRTTRSGPNGFALNAIVWHHTATSTAWADGHVAALLRDGRRDLPGPLSQVGVERDGTWVIVACGKANHNGFGQYGNDSLGLEFYNSGVGEPWPDVQVESGVRGIAAIQRYLPKPVPLVGHKESDPQRKIDPFGLDMDWVRERVQQFSDDLVSEGSFEDMVIIQHPTGAAVGVTGNSLVGIKASKTLQNFVERGIPVVPVDDSTWQDWHRVLNS